jgi:hypothetical protein
MKINPGLKTEHEYKSKESFPDIGLKIGRIVEEKNTAYGDSVIRSANIMKILYPNGIMPCDYIHTNLVIRILDKLCRLSSDPFAFGENPYEDIAGYSIRGSEIAKNKIAELKRIQEELSKVVRNNG